jgi:hypothetical protein
MMHGGLTRGMRMLVHREARQRVSAWVQSKGILVRLTSLLVDNG